MALCNVINKWVIFLTSITCLVSSQEDNCGVDSLFCDVPTRLPGFIPSDCSHPCSFVFPEGGCRLNPVCFFKSVVGLVQPAGYEHLLDLSSVETVQDAKRRVSILFHMIGIEKVELDGLADIVAATYFQFHNDKFSGTNKLVLPDEINNSPCSGFCKSVDNDGECNVNATCYFQNKLEQSTTANISPLLDLSPALNDFDEDFLVKKLFERIKGEKMKLDTLWRYVVNTFNVMVDIEESNGNSGFIIRQGCGGGFGVGGGFGGGGGFSSGGGIGGGGLGGPGIVGGLPSSCPGVCATTDSNADCRGDFRCLLEHYSYS